MKTIAEYEVRMPTWALSYIVNNDPSGLDAIEIKKVDDFLNQFYRQANAFGGHVIIGSTNPDQQEYFTHKPAFGLACNVEDYTILIVKNETDYRNNPHASHFSEFEGDLYDDRKPGSKPIRKRVTWHYKHIKTGSQLLATLRAGSVAWPGGYPLFFITSDGTALTFDSVKANLRSVIDSIRNKIDDGWRVVGCNVNWEDTNLIDDHTGKQIPSAYSDDDDEKDFEGQHGNG